MREVLRKSIIESARRCLVVAMLERKAALIEGRIDSRDSRPTNLIVGNCVGGVEAVVICQFGDVSDCVRRKQKLVLVVCDSLLSHAATNI